MSYDLLFSKQALSDIEFHKKAGKKVILNKLLILLSEIAEHPFDGSGKPEPLKYALKGCWSRRISREHRLIYEVSSDSVHILSALGHYE